MSGQARQLLASDFEHRYSSEDRFYRGTRYIHEVQDLAEGLACRVFRYKYADVTPLSGHISDMASLSLLSKPGDVVTSVSPDDGGYSGLSQQGESRLLGLEHHCFSYDRQSMNIRIQESRELISARRPRLLSLVPASFAFPHSGSRAFLRARRGHGLYDGSHVLGLIAGQEFQDAINEGPDLFVGSTHKRLFGPQRGIILSNDEERFNTVERGLHPGLVNNIHRNRLATPAYALIEMQKFGASYAR